MIIQTIRFRSTLAQVNSYATKFVITEVTSQDINKYYNEESLAVILKFVYGIKNRVKLWYWKVVYKALVAYYRRIANKAAKKYLKEQLNK